MSKLSIFLTTLMIVPIASSGATNWHPPSENFDGSLHQEYLAPQSEYGPGHRGVDIKVEIGGSLLAPTDSVLTFKAVVVDRPVVTFQTTDGYLLSFEPACSKLQIGEAIKSGQKLGWHCTPASEYQYHCLQCVHVSARSQFGYLSPLWLMGRMVPSQLES